jgi:carboxyl-terminal processing protease
LHLIKSGVDSNPDKDKLLRVVDFVKKGHYDPATIDDKFSKGIYKATFEQIPQSDFFLQSDIDEFSKYEAELMTN